MNVNINRGKRLRNELEEKTKVRAIIKNNDKFLLVNYGGLYMFPGGKLEDNEYLSNAIKRELKEEIGIDYEISELAPLTSFEQTQKNYPKRDGKIVDRIITTFYFIAPYKGINLDNTNLSEKEKRENFKLEFLTEEEINLYILNDNSNNPRKKYFVEELITILEFYKEYEKRNIKTYITKSKKFSSN